MDQSVDGNVVSSETAPATIEASDSDTPILPEHAIDPGATPTHVAQYDHGSEIDDLTVAIVEAISSVKDINPSRLVEQLGTVVDPDRLEFLFRPTGNGPPSTGWLTFEFADCWVTVTSDGEIRIYDPTHDHGD